MFISIAMAFRSFSIASSERNAEFYMYTCTVFVAQI